MIDQTAEVGRRKKGEPPRKPITLTLAQDVRQALEDQEYVTGAPMSRTVDRAVRAYLKLPDPAPSPESPPTE